MSEVFSSGSPLDKGTKSEGQLSDFQRRVAGVLNNPSVQIQLLADFKEYLVQYFALNQPPIPISQIIGSFEIGPGDPVTTLPTAASDRQQALLVDSATTPTFAWLLQYFEEITDTNKWLFLGGTPAYAEVAAQETTSSTSYTDLATVGPAITLPCAGDYIISVGAKVRGPAAFTESALMSYNVGATGASDDDAMSVTQHDAAVPRLETSGTRRRRTSFSAVTLTTKYRCTSSTVAFANRWIEVIPIRVRAS